LPTTPQKQASSEPRPIADSEQQAISGVRTALVTASPKGARFYLKGKEVGVTTLTVDVPIGEKRAFEVGFPGYITRKVIVDGSKPEIFVGLNPERPAKSSPQP
jgi:hypothetical protein